MTRPASMPYLVIYVHIYDIYIYMRVVVLLYAFVYTHNLLHTLSAVRLLRVAVALGTPGRPTYGGHCTEETKCSIKTSLPLH